MQSCAFGQFIYTVNARNDVSAYTVDSNTGKLTVVPGSAVAAGTAPVSVTVDPASRFVYVANSGSGDVSAFRVGDSGALTPVPGSPFAAGVAPAGITVDPAAKFVYVANSGSRDVSVFRIGVEGGLIPVPGSPFGAGATPRGVITDPSGRFLFVTNSELSGISVYAISAATGALTPTPETPYASGVDARDAAVDPGGKFLYVTGTDTAGHGIWTYSINSGSGALFPVPGSPFRLNAAPLSLAVHPTGKFVYVSSDSSISLFSVDAGTGTLTSAPGWALTGGLFWSGLMMDPTGKFLYEANDLPGNISTFSIDAATGALTPVRGSSFGMGARGIALANSTAKPKAVLSAAGDPVLITGYVPGTLRNDITGFLGLQFTVGASALNVSALGRVFISGNTGTHTLKLVRVSDGTDVPNGSVTITLNSGMTADQLNYANLSTPVTLAANTSYYLLSQETSGGDQWYDLSAVTPSAAASVDLAAVWLSGFGYHGVGAVNQSFVPVSLAYTLATAPPAVSITLPAPGASLSGASVPLSATATAATGLTIANVKFFVDNANPITATPGAGNTYTATLNSTSLTNGLHALTAVATDSAGASTTSLPVNVTVNNTGTSVSITLPAAGASVSGSAVPLSATAIAGTGLNITAVQFFVDNANPVNASSGGGNTYTATLNSTSLSNGAHSLTAVASDSGGHQVTSSAVAITVANGGAPPSGTALISGYAPGSPRNDITGFFGLQFTVGASALNVSALGRVFISGNTGTHTVKLVRVSDGSDVPNGSVTIPLNAGMPAGQFVYANLATPVTLAANTAYYLLS
ncbi:MAG: beta-propeller fold lactonase family protein, partial [Nitrospira sp.]|nr:beta-propeller fold lactonase family protein [Nitrospira sp.]